jgi:folate-binding protein YgfZ
VIGELAWSTITVSGEDATSFLDGQLAQDVASAIDGAWTAVLEPEGTVLCAGWLRGGESSYEILVPAALAEPARARLARFRLRVRADIDVSVGATDPPMSSVDELLEGAMPWAAEFAAGLSPHGFGAGFVGRSISFTKGCFTGQELVARMDVRGAATPFRFARVRAGSIERANEVIAAAGPPRGQGVTTVFRDDGELVAHAIVHRSLLERHESPDVVVEVID